MLLAGLPYKVGQFEDCSQAKVQENIESFLMRHETIVIPYNIQRSLCNTAALVVWRIDIPIAVESNSPTAARAPARGRGRYML